LRRSTNIDVIKSDLKFIRRTFQETEINKSRDLQNFEYNNRTW